MIFLLHFGKSVFCRKNGLLQPLVRAFLSVWVYLRIGLGLKCQKRAKFRQIRRFAIFAFLMPPRPYVFREGTGCFVPRGTFFRSFYREVFCRASSWNFALLPADGFANKNFPQMGLSLCAFYGGNVCAAILNIFLLRLCGGIFDKAAR